MKEIQVAERQPELDEFGVPTWWHHHGLKLGVLGVDLAHGIVRLQASAAELAIKKLGEDDYLVSWGVIQSQTEFASGRTRMNQRTVRQAFGLENGSIKKTDVWLINRYGGTVARQFCFIRYQDFLNIPCPGTGHDGDPNISIELDNEIRTAVLSLVAAT